VSTFTSSRMCLWDVVAPFTVVVVVVFVTRTLSIRWRSVFFLTSWLRFVVRRLGLPFAVPGFFFFFFFLPALAVFFLCFRRAAVRAP
jgi:hypothetical protein